MSCGFLFINKPVGPTSHDIVNQLRKITGIKRIGHCGTLDPFASGLLIFGIGRPATKQLSNFLKADKEYFATLLLGATSNTGDRTGAIIKYNPYLKTNDDNKKPASNNKNNQPTLSRINRVLKRFIGNIEQTPPMYSAKKINGVRLYKLARQGKVVARKKQKITIKQIKLINYCWPRLSLKISCSSGTYIRSLGQDIGISLGCGAYLDELTRWSINSITLKQAIELKKINRDNWSNYLQKLFHSYNATNA